MKSLFTIALAVGLVTGCSQHKVAPEGWSIVTDGRGNYTWVDSDGYQSFLQEYDSKSEAIDSAWRQYEYRLEHQPKVWTKAP